MALLGGLLSSQKREERAVMRALTELSDQKTPVRLESENNGLSFFTVLSLRKNAMLVARPRTVRQTLAKDSMVRLTLTNQGRKQVRAKVLVPHLKVPFSIKHVLVCEVPKEFSGVCRRSADRFSTGRFKNLILQTDEPTRNYRVVDLSTSGCKILLPDGMPHGLMEPGAELLPARLRLGRHALIELDRLVVRSSNDRAAGLELRVRRDGASERYLMNLLNKLAATEIQRLRVDTA